MKRLLSLAVLLNLVVAVPEQASAGVSIDKACDQAFVENRKESETVNVGPHGFRVKPATVSRDGDSIRVQGFFFHVISGRNDRVHYLIEVKKGQPYTATIETIEYGGLVGRDSKLKVGVTWTARIGGGLAGAKLIGAEGADEGVAVGEKVGKVILKVANAVQRKLIGKWEPSAPEILDGIANYFANQL